MIDEQTPAPAGLPRQRTAPAVESDQAPMEDHRPRYLRWLLPTSFASAVPLDHGQEARLKFIALH